MSATRIAAVILMLGVVAAVIVVVVGIPRHNESVRVCSDRGGHWLERSNLCISNDAIVPMP